MNLRRSSFQQVVKTHEANVEGPLQGYCGACGLMLTDADWCCPKCGSEDITQKAPAESVSLYTRGYTRDTGGPSTRTNSV